MLVRKLRLERAWSQETLAEISGLSVRTIQRIERGAGPSLETRAALAAAFEVDAAIFTEETAMSTSATTSTATTTPAITEAERDALEYVRDIKGFYNHAISYVLANLCIFGAWLVSGSDYPWFLWAAFGWGIGLASHALSVFEIFSLFSPDWERRQIEKRLARQTSRSAR